MKKFYTLIMSAVVLGFCGCAGTSPEAEAGVKVEKVVAPYKIASYASVDEAKNKHSSNGFDG